MEAKLTCPGHNQGAVRICQLQEYGRGAFTMGLTGAVLSKSNCHTE